MAALLGQPYRRPELRPLLLPPRILETPLSLAAALASLAANALQGLLRAHASALQRTWVAHPALQLPQLPDSPHFAVAHAAAFWGGMLLVVHHRCIDSHEAAGHHGLPGPEA